MGYTKYRFDQKNVTTWSRHWQAFNGVTTGSPRITFTNFTIGGNAFYPRFGAQESLLIRDDFTFSLNARGRHDMKTGVDYLRVVDSGDNCQACMGQIDARNGPTPANIEALFPDRVQRGHVESSGDLLHHAELSPGRRQLRDARCPAEVQHLAAGRLADLFEADAQSGRPVRSQRERAGE